MNVWLLHLWGLHILCWYGATYAYYTRRLCVMASQRTNVRWKILPFVQLLAFRGPVLVTSNILYFIYVYCGRRISIEASSGGGGGPKIYKHYHLPEGMRHIPIPNKIGERIDCISWPREITRATLKWEAHHFGRLWVFFPFSYLQDQSLGFCKSPLDTTLSLYTNPNAKEKGKRKANCSYVYTIITDLLSFSIKVYSLKSGAKHADVYRLTSSVKYRFRMIDWTQFNQLRLFLNINTGSFIWNTWILFDPNADTTDTLMQWNCLSHHLWQTLRVTFSFSPSSQVLHFSLFFFNIQIELHLEQCSCIIGNAKQKNWQEMAYRLGIRIYLFVYNKL